MTFTLIFTLILCLVWSLWILAAWREAFWGDAQSHEIEVSGQGATKVAMAQLRTQSHPAANASPPDLERNKHERTRKTPTVPMLRSVINKLGAIGFKSPFPKVTDSANEISRSNRIIPLPHRIRREILGKIVRRVK